MLNQKFQEQMMPIALKLDPRMKFSIRLVRIRNFPQIKKKEEEMEQPNLVSPESASIQDERRREDNHHGALYNEKLSS